MISKLQEMIYKLLNITDFCVVFLHFWNVPGRFLSVPRMKLIINSPTSCQPGPLDRTGGL